jgi:tetratricopeptide (TPR) repeat protein
MLLLLSVGFSGCTTSDAQEDVLAKGPDPVQALKDASDFYKDRGDVDNARKAVSTLASARNMDNRDYQVEWTFAHYSYFLGSRDEIEDKEREKVMKAGLTAASIARRMEPGKTEGHFWYAAILGEQSKRSPVTVGIVSVEKIRSAMNKVIEIDPKYQAASAYDALGQLEMATRGLAGGSIEKAIEYYQKAVDLKVDNSYLQLHLAEAYLALGKKPEAKRLLQGILAHDPDPDFIPEHEECVKDAKLLLKKKF